MVILDGFGHAVESFPPGKKCVLLNSRQSKRPCGRDPWVMATCRAVRGVLESDSVLITSMGMNTWELALHLANTLGGRQIVILPAADRSSAVDQVRLISRDFQLAPERTHFMLLVSGDGAGRRGKDAWPERDRFALELADEIVPISIRSGGALENLIAEAVSTGKSVLTDFRIGYSSPVDHVRYDFQKERLNPLLDSAGRPFLVHWTRSAHGPWPGESAFEFYRDLLAGETYPRSALYALMRIAGEQMIRASGRFLRGELKAVSFSSLPPGQAIGLMRWRRRYVGYSLEPYGVAIDRQAAIPAGIRPVIYGDEFVYSRLPEPDRPYFQNRGSGDVDWRPESEWRHIGDFDLSALPPDSIRLFTFTRQEAMALQSRSRFEVVPLTIS